MYDPGGMGVRACCVFVELLLGAVGLFTGEQKCASPIP
jgi:hypothetical protein